MSKSNGETPNSSNVTLPDIREQVEHDRLGELRDARRQVRTARDQSMYAAASGQIPRGKANALYLNTLQSFLHLLRPYADRDDYTRQYWSGTEDRTIGAVVAQVPPPGYDGWENTGSRDSDAGSYDDLEPQVVDRWDGLTDVLTATPTRRATWSYLATPAHLAPRVKRCQTIAFPDRTLIDQALTWTTDFCADVGLDLDVSVGASDYELKYSDLI